MNWFIDNKLNELFIAVEWAEKGDLKLLIKKAIEEKSCNALLLKVGVWAVGGGAVWCGLG